MFRYRWTGTLLLVGGISAILLCFISKVHGFPKDAMLVFWPANYVWHELQGEIQHYLLKRLVGNVAVFAVLAAAEGALAGMVLDFLIAARRVSLDLRVRRMRRDAQHRDPACKRRILEILTKYDPAGLAQSNAGQPAYHTQANAIMNNMSKLRGVKEVQRFCRQQLRRQFGSEALGKFDGYDPLATEIWQTYQRQQSTDRRPTPVSKGL